MKEGVHIDRGSYYGWEIEWNLGYYPCFYFAVKYICIMTYCVAITAKEGDLWIQSFDCILSLMLHRCQVYTE